MLIAEGFTNQDLRPGVVTIGSGITAEQGDSIIGHLGCIVDELAAIRSHFECEDDDGFWADSAPTAEDEQRSVDQGRWEACAEQVRELREELSVVKAEKEALETRVFILEGRRP